MKKKSVLIILGILAGLNILAWLAVLELSHTQYLEVTFFDVGQGDSIFIETPQSHQILIDGGPTSIILEKLGEEMPFYDKTIDLIILTHPDHDHIAGLIEVLKNYKVDNILWTGATKDTAEFEEWQRLIEEERAQIYIAQAGQRINGGQTSIDILHPFESLEGESLENTNNTSIVAKLIFSNNTFLFTGDIYDSVEKELLLNSELSSEVLKVGHHGSKSSSGEDFIRAVGPAIAVISSGRDNYYGHPHKETLDALEKYDITILRTDINGDIKIISNGNFYEIIAEISTKL